MPRWQIAVILAALAGYAVGSHLLMIYAADKPWAVAALFGPLVLGVGGVALQRRHAPSVAGCAALVAVLVVVVARGGVGDVNRLYVLQHVGIHLVLAWSFAITLRPGATARITQLAQQVHTHVTPQMRVYTRQLTGWWVGYFVGMAGASVALYLVAPWAWWSFFGNVLTPALAISFFVGEHVLRYWRHPEFERVSLTRAVRAYRAAHAADAGSR